MENISGSILKRYAFLVCAFTTFTFPLSCSFYDVRITPEDFAVDFAEASPVLSHLLTKKDEVLGESGQELLGAKNLEEMKSWVNKWKEKLSYSEMMMQLASASRNLAFYIKTGAALSDEEFLALIKLAYSQENPERLQLLDLFKALFKFSDSVRHYEERGLKLSFSDDSGESFNSYLDAYNDFGISGRERSTVAVYGHLLVCTGVHANISELCLYKIKEFGMDYLSPVGKFGAISYITARYENIGNCCAKFFNAHPNADDEVSFRLLVNELSKLFPKKPSKPPRIPGPPKASEPSKDFALPEDHDGVLLNFFSEIIDLPNPLRVVPLERDRILQIAAFFGLPRVFGGLVERDREYFKLKMERISGDAFRGNSMEIIRICKEFDSQFKSLEGKGLYCDYNARGWFRYSPQITYNFCYLIPGCFYTAYGNSAINILHWMLPQYPNCADISKWGLEFSGRHYLVNLISHFHDGPVTTDKIHFLLNSIHKYFSIKLENGKDFPERIRLANLLLDQAVKANVMVVIKYLIETGTVSLNERPRYGSNTPFVSAFTPNLEGLVDFHCRLNLLNRDIVKYLVEHGGDPNINIGDPVGRLGGERQSLLEIARKNNDQDFVQFLLAHGAR